MHPDTLPPSIVPHRKTIGTTAPLYWFPKIAAVLQRPQGGRRPSRSAAAAAAAQIDLAALGPTIGTAEYVRLEAVVRVLGQQQCTLADLEHTFLPAWRELEAAHSSHFSNSVDVLAPRELHARLIGE
jgi:hypothetical protein